VIALHMFQTSYGMQKGDDEGSLVGGLCELLLLDLREKQKTRR